jgi:hypothetical protein
MALLLCGGARAHAQDLSKLASDLATRIHAKNHERVTVVDFVDLDKKPNKLAKFLTLQLVSALNEPDLNLVVVDQSHIPELFDQMEKLSEGLIDPATAKQLGKMSGAEVLIYGTVMVSTLSVRLDVSAIDLETAKVIASGNASPKRFGMVDRLAKEVELAEGGGTSEQDETEVATKPVPVKKSPIRVRRDQGFVFELGGCSSSADAVTCSIIVTSEERDQLLTISNRSRVWNQEGEEFPPEELTIANSRDDDSCLSKQILRDVPTSIRLTFPHFGGDGVAVERLRLAWAQNEYCHGLRTVDFDKIPLSADAGRKASSGVGSAGNAVGSQKKGGGLFGRLTEKLIDTAASTAEKYIDKKAKELTGEDEEEEEDPPQE